MDTLDGKEFAYDFETYGTDWMVDTFWVRSVSFHNDEVSCAIELADENGVYYNGSSAIFKWLSKQPKTIAHNAQFESGVVFAMTDVYVPPYRCTWAMAKTLSTEGFFSQQWGLKYLGNKLLGWEDWSKKVIKGALMGTTPWEHLGPYNQLDSAATWELYKMFNECVKEYSWGDTYNTFLDEDITTNLVLHNEAYRTGLKIDIDYTKDYINRVEKEAGEALSEFLCHEDVAPHIERFNKAVVEKQEEKIRNYNKKYKKDGSPTVNFLNLQKTLEEVKNTTHFNINSTDQLRWLIYDALKVPCELFTDKGAASTKKNALSRIPLYGEMILHYREKISLFKFCRAVLANQHDGVFRPDIILPSTLTGRPSSRAPEE